MQKQLTGFTLVELLITIVIIAVLSTIAIVGYNGIQQRTRESRIQYQLTQGRKQMELYKIDNGVWPFEQNVRQRIANSSNPTSASTQMDIICDEVRSYLVDNGNLISGQSGGDTGGTACVGSRIDASNQIYFCYGVPVDARSDTFEVSTANSFYISSKKLGVSPKGNYSCCIS